MLKILKASEYKSVRSAPTDPIITISHTGVITINHPAMELLAVKTGDRVLIAKDTAGDYLIAKGKSNNPDGFLLRDYHTKKYVQFNAKGLIIEIVKTKDLALAKDKKKTMRFALNTDPVQELAGSQFFEIII